MASMPTLKEHAYKAILKRLYSGSSLPGTRLSDEVIAKEIGISRSPVREAISRLASEGIVEYQPRRGAFIRVPTRQEIEDLFEARLALEGFAAARAAEVVRDEDLAELEDFNKKLLATVQACRQRPSKIADRPLVDRFLKADFRFHQKIVDILGNNTIMAMINECRILSRLFAHMTMDHDLHLMAHTYRQHTALLRAIRRRDSQGAAHWMNYHIKSTAKTVLKAFNDKS